MQPAKRSLIDSGGLSHLEVIKRQETDGLNELPTTKPKTIRHLLSELFRDPMVFILVACGLIYFALGDPQEAAMLLGFLAIIIGITAYQEIKAEHALEALRDLTSPRALVLRSGNQIRIAGKEVVRDDTVFIHEGDRVPADGLLITSSNLAADESLLTGESEPVEKTAAESLQKSEPNHDKLFAGTVIVRGQGIMQVQAIGLQTKLGRIGKLILSNQPELTSLELETRHLICIFSWIAGSICVAVVVVYGLTRNNWLDGFLAGLTLAMAILPNELPAVLTIFLALGAWRISKKRVLTRKMSALENLGAVTTLCVDKTGTLTLNRMSIQKLYAQGQTYELHGDLELHGDRSGDLRSRRHQKIPEEFHEVLEFGILASRPDPFDPMEQAFVLIGTHYLNKSEHLHTHWKLEKEYPLSSELLSISQAWRSTNTSPYVIGAKGAPEAIIDLCHMSPADSSALTTQVQRMTDEGLRVLGVAKARFNSTHLPVKQHDFDFEFLGLVGLSDPIRNEVPQAIEECKTAGIRVLMITGDHPNTARSIARKIGLQNSDRVVTGAELNRMSEIDLRRSITQCSIFSRVSPDQKLRIVEILKGNGEIVAMTGDGVNDAPALKNAHVGIAMGGRGTDVARESAALVLLDDDFASIVEAIKMGRRIRANLRSALTYLLAVHIPIAGISILPVFLGLPLVLLPAHIAFLHLIIEPACSIAFEADSAQPEIMKQPPRNPKDRLFNRKIIVPTLVQGGSVLLALSAIYLISLYRGQGEDDGRALVFTSLIISNIVLILTSRGSGASLRRGFDLSKNRTLKWILFGAVALLALVLYHPGLRHVFRFSQLHLIDLVNCLAVGVLSVIWFELLKKLGTRGKTTPKTASW